MSLKSAPQAIQCLLSSSRTLSELLEEARSRSQLSGRIRLMLPAELHPHCLGTGLKDDTLTLYTDTPAWATSLRYQYRHLLAQLKQQHDLCHIRQIRVRIQPRPARQSAGQPHSSWPARMADPCLLDSLAESVVDPRIQATLKRISRRISGATR